MKQLTVAILGLGLRGNTYASLMAQFPERVKIVAGADLIREKRELFQDKYGIPDENIFDSDIELFKAGKLADILIVSTQDRQHAGHAIQAMELGYEILCEKPVSPIAKDCLDVAAASERTGKKVVVCHVLRYSPFFMKMKQLIDSGAIGELVAVDAIEKVRYWHQAHSFVRGDWRNSKETSPMILAKSCHDMDILLYLTGKHCLSVNSIGSLKHFRRENAPQGASERCTDKCPDYYTCPYSVENCYLKRARNGDFAWPTNRLTLKNTLEDLEYQLSVNEFGRCVYFCDNDVVDHQMVDLQLEDGVTVAFTMCAFTSGGGRRIHVMGTMGDMIGELEEDRIALTRFGHETEYIDTSTAGTEEYGHGGGDMGLVVDLLNVMSRSGANTSVTSIQNSIESHIVALAAEESRVNGGNTVRIADFIEGVKG